MLSDGNRSIGINSIKEIHWESHFCFFYQKKEDLLKLLVPYFKKGLQNNECCLWVTSGDISGEEAIIAMRKAIKNFDGYLKKGQIEIIPYSNWYFKDKVLDLDNALNRVKAKLDYSLRKNYEGLRASCDCRWLKRKDLDAYLAFEKKNDDMVGNNRMMVICSYPINKYRKTDILDISNTHNFVIFNGKGDYKIIESSDRKQIKEEKKLLSIISSGVAHDFKNLLTIIKGNTELALMQVGENAPIKKYLMEIKQSINSAAPLIQQLYDYNRKDQIVMKTININKIIIKLLAMLTLFDKEDVKIEVENDLEKELWSVQANSGKVEQAIINLLLNAKDAMPIGGKITIKTQNITIDKSYHITNPEANPGDYICVSIEDTGIGIEKNTIKQIFKPFFTTKAPGKGIGLGLSIVYHAITEHQGWIDVFSELNKGTTFKFYLPANR